MLDTNTDSRQILQPTLLPQPSTSADCPANVRLFPKSPKQVGSIKWNTTNNRIVTDTPIKESIDKDNDARRSKKKVRLTTRGTGLMQSVKNVMSFEANNENNPTISFQEGIRNLPRVIVKKESSNQESWFALFAKKTE